MHVRNIYIVIVKGRAISLVYSKLNREEESDMDYKFNRRYFESINWILVTILAVVGLVLLYFYILIGIVILLGLGVYIYFKLKDRPTDEDIDAVFEEHVNTVLQKGYDKLGLDPDDVNLNDPVLLHGPLLDQISFSPFTKRGKDQKVRSSNYQAIVFYFNEKQMHVYNYSFSIIDDERNEVMDEYFYHDIVSASTSSTTTLFYDSGKKRDEFFNLEVFKLTFTGATGIECSIQDLQTVGSKILDMKKLIREKKLSQQHS